ncbi:MAG: flagellar export chaperone FlgN [Candidatus Marinimicrobia bacterium]|nr:flagellar export chaperone FlgN [Candidatus Neomarinimicrobiota bacterium]
MVNKEELVHILKEQVKTYAEFETLCKSEIDALYKDKLNDLLSVMKNKAILIEKLNKLDIRLKNSQNSGFNTDLSVKTDPVLKNFAEKAIKKVENVLKLEGKIKDVSQKQLNKLERELLSIGKETETLGKYAERGFPNARFIDINR